MKHRKSKSFWKKSSLPTEYIIKDVDDFYEHFFLDKKSANNSITFILPDGLGGHKMVSDIDAMLVKKVLAQFWSCMMLKRLLFLSFLSVSLLQAQTGGKNEKQ